MISSILLWMFLFRRIWTTASESSRVEAFLELHGAHGNKVQNWYVEMGEHVPVKKLQFTIWDGEQTHTNSIKFLTSTASTWTHQCHYHGPGGVSWCLKTQGGISTTPKMPTRRMGWEGWNLWTSKPFLGFQLLRDRNMVIFAGTSKSSSFDLLRIC